MIGAGVGAIAGNLFGRSKDAADQQQAAAGYASTQRANQQAAALAVTNFDLIQMQQAGLSEAVILGAIQQRGARLDLSPNGLIQLKQAGVSDNILVTAQRASVLPAQQPAVAQAPTRTVVIDRRPTYYYEPQPRVYFHIGGRPHPHRRGPRW